MRGDDDGRGMMLGGRRRGRGDESNDWERREDLGRGGGARGEERMIGDRPH